MINIKRFIDKVSAMDARSGRDIILSAGEARQLRDEIFKLLIDKTEDKLRQKVKNPEPQDSGNINISGGRW